VASFDWFPVEVLAWDRDTAHLSCLEDGAYWRLVRHYMLTRMPLPDDDRALANIVGVSIEEWADMQHTIRSFFKQGENPPRLSHKRCDAEIKEQSRRSETRQKAGRKGGNRTATLKKAKAQSAQRKQPPASNATAMPQQSYSDAQAEVQLGSSRPQAKSKQNAAQDKDILSSNKDGLSSTVPEGPIVHEMNTVTPDGPGNGSGNPIGDDMDKTSPPPEPPMPGQDGPALADDHHTDLMYREATCLSVLELMDEVFGDKDRSGVLVRAAMNTYIDGGFDHHVLIEAAHDVLTSWNQLPIFNEEAWLMKGVNNWMTERGYTQDVSFTDPGGETEEQMRQRVAEEFGHE